MLFNLEQKMSTSPSSPLPNSLSLDTIYHHLGLSLLPFRLQHEAQVKKRYHVQEQQKPVPFQSLSVRTEWTLGLGRRGHMVPGCTWVSFLPNAVVGFWMLILHKTWVLTVPAKNTDSYTRKSREMPPQSPQRTDLSYF